MPDLDPNAERGPAATGPRIPSTTTTAPHCNASDPPRVEIPIGPERAWVACAVESREGTRLAFANGTPDDLYDRRLARVLRACAELDDVGPFSYCWQEAARLWPWTPPDSARVRAAAVATMADLPLIEVEQLVSEPRPCATDSAGRLARLVAIAAAKRRRMAELAAEYEALAVGAA